MQVNRKGEYELTTTTTRRRPEEDILKRSGFLGDVVPSQSGVSEKKGS